MIPHPPILLITDSRQAATPLPDIIAAALRGGCRWVMLREHENIETDEEEIALGRKIRNLCDAHHAKFSVGRNILLAAESDADGVHLPAGGDGWTARQMGHAELILGQSCHNKREAVEAEQNGVDYITLSPVFVSESKPDYGPALGLQKLKDITKILPLPVFALGGMTPEKAKLCLENGARGIAVMGDMMRSTNPESRMREYVKLFAS